ncbi:MAG TPA: hypothetical protein VIY09_03015 [Rhizomicrobium sp.]|jgi:hypothetical protein
MLVTLFAVPFSVLAGRCHRLFRIASAPYRPELHYMRGPGPACRAKQREGL